jgi:hypothetical protein
MIWRFGRSQQAAARHERVFREAQRRLGLEIRAITHRNAASGPLKSGATIKAIVRAIDETTIVALTEALDGISTVTDHAGAKRKRLIEDLRANLADHELAAQEMSRLAIERIGLGSDFKHAVPLIEEARARHHDKIADFGEGWTAPTTKSWNDRHPILFALVVAAIGAAVGVAGTSMADQLMESRSELK